MWDSWEHAAKGLYLSSKSNFVTSVAIHDCSKDWTKLFYFDRFRGQPGPLVLEFFKKWWANRRDWWANWPTSTLLKKACWCFIFQALLSSSFLPLQFLMILIPSLHLSFSIEYPLLIFQIFYLFVLEFLFLSCAGHIHPVF